MHMFGLNRKLKSKIISSAPKIVKDVVTAVNKNNYAKTKTVNLIKPSFKSNRNNGIAGYVERSVSKFADVENFGERAKALTDKLFEEFNFKK